MKYKNILAVCVAFALILGGCGSAASDTSEPESEAAGEVTEINSQEMFSDRDFDTEYDADKSVQITFAGTTIQSSDNSVEIEGGTVTIREEGTYILSGESDDGMVIVDGDKKEKIQLVLDGVNIHSNSGAPVYIKQSDKVFLTLAKDSQNTLSNDGSFAAEEEGVDAVIYSKEDLTINGEGALTISSPGGHGVVSKDELTITGGVYDITCASHGFSGKDGIGIAGGVFQIVSGKDGIHGENKDDTSLGYVYIQNGVFEIRAEEDGISAVSAMQIDGGTFDIAVEDDAFHAEETLTITGGSIDVSACYEGLEALHVEIAGGDISLVSQDDGINAAGDTDSEGFGDMPGDMFGGRRPEDVSIGDMPGDMFGGRRPEDVSIGDRPEGMHGGKKPDGMFNGNKPDNMPAGMPGGGPGNGSISISGGTLYVEASGDGIDANGSLEISGGSIVICGPTHGDTATLDYDTTAVITGGTFIGTGAAGMARNFSDSKQGVIFVNVGNTAAGTEITLTDSKGNTILTQSPKLDFSVVTLSSPEIVSGEVYTLTIGSVSTQYMAE